MTRENFAAFTGLTPTNESTVSSRFLIGFLARAGLTSDDPRLSTFFSHLRSLNAVDTDVELDLVQFNTITSGDCSMLLQHCFTGELRIPNFSACTAALTEIYNEVLSDTKGAQAKYIPSLARVDPEQFGVSITSVNGQHFSIGDVDVQFSVQSCANVVTYLAALSEFGPQFVHNHVGLEPSGRPYDEMVLKSKPEPERPKRQIPHNPCVSAGGIMSASIVCSAEPTLERRREHVVEVFKSLSSGLSPTVGVVEYDEQMFIEEARAARSDRNWGLAYMMKERGAFPDSFNGLDQTIALYQQVCSISSTTRAMSVLAATLANGGLNPYTGGRVFSADHVRSVLPIMLMSGMYDYSGQWAYDIGVPAKASASGCIFLVVPNICGIAIWSPRLGTTGNSQRGIAVARELSKRFALHNFEVFSGLARSKIDLTRAKNQEAQAALADLFSAASVVPHTPLPDMLAFVGVFSEMFW